MRKYAFVSFHIIRTKLTYNKRKNLKPVVSKREIFLEEMRALLAPGKKGEIGYLCKFRNAPLHGRKISGHTAIKEVNKIFFYVCSHAYIYTFYLYLYSGASCRELLLFFVLPPTRKS